MEWIIMSDELEHAGKRGMHWGERNYQRKDGTWTPLGLRLRRIREGGSGSKRKPSGDAQKRAERKNEIKNLQSKAELESAKAAYKINKAQNKSAVQAAKAGAASIGNKIKDATKKAVEAHKEKKREESVEDIVRSGDMNKILSSKTKLTEDELRTAVNRLRLEQDLKDVGAREKARGQETFKKFANTASDVANLTKSGIDVYNNVAKVINTFTGRDLKTIGGNSGESAYTRAMNAARLRTAEAAATTAEVNARNATQMEAEARTRRMNEARASVADEWRRRREDRRNAQESAHEAYTRTSAETRERIARAEQREAEGNARDAEIRELERTAPARANAGFHAFRDAQRAAQNAESTRPSELPGPTLYEARSLVDNIIGREDD